MFVGLMRQGILRRVSAVVYFADDSQVIRRGSFKQVVRLLNPSNCYSASTARNVKHSTGASNITAEVLDFWLIHMGLSAYLRISSGYARSAKKRVHSECPPPRRSSTPSPTKPQPLRPIRFCLL